KAGSRYGGAVVAVLTADDDFLLRLPLACPVMAYQTQHGVVAFGARAGEEHVVHPFRSQLGNGLGQLQYRRMRSLEEGVVERQLAHLGTGRLDQLLAAITHGHAPQAGHAVEDFVALAFPQLYALRLGDGARALLVQLAVVAEGRQMVGPAQSLPVCGLRVFRLFVHLQHLLGAGCRTSRWNSWCRSQQVRPATPYTDSSRNSRSQELITRLKFSCSARLTAT